MRAHYGIILGLAIGLPAMASGMVEAQDAPNLPQVRHAAAVQASGLAPQTVRMATVRQASVTVVDQTPNIGLSQVTQQVEDYFNNLTSLQASFTQTVTGDKRDAVGTFYLKRPGQFLWQYDTPVKQRIISTGSAVYYIDQERNQVTQLPMNAGVARLFNAKTLNLSKQGLRATHVTANSHLLEVDFAVDKKIATSDQAGLVSLKLVFDRVAGNGLLLRQIDALDTLSVTTRVAFTQVQENLSLPTKMFQFTPGVYEQRN